MAENISISIEKEIVALIKHKPFYAHFIQTMKRHITRDIPTMGVNITDAINLYINPDFFAKLTPPERVACLEHEVLHIINKHILRGRKYEPTLYNMACDIAINQYIKEFTYHNRQDGKTYIISKLPKNTLLPETFNLPHEKTAEEYYKLLFKNAKKLKLEMGDSKPCQDGEGGEGKGEGNGRPKTLDDHDIWGKGNKNEDFQHQVIKNAIRKTLESTKDYGHLPAGIQAEINKALAHETLNWRALLQRFINRATLINTLPTRKRPNRRYGVFYDGSKVDYKLDMMVAVDTSGSISDLDLALFFSEIERIKALGMKIMVVECDAAVQKTYKYKTIPKIVCGRGGTDFAPVFKYANALKPQPNCIIYLTDLYADFSQLKNITRIPTLWAVSQSGGDEKNVPFGYGVKLKDDKEKE